MKSQHKLHQVIAYIEQHLDEELSLELLSSIACLSKFHFHRQFSLYFGLSAKTYIKTLRLKQASYQLAYRTDKKIIDIAIEQSYESSEAFSRAFKKCFDVAPSTFRKAPPWFTWQEKLNYFEKLRNIMKAKNVHVQKDKNIKVDVIEFPSINVAVYQHRGAPYLLGDSIRQFIIWRKKHKLSPKISRTFNLVYDNPYTTEAEDYRFDLCAQFTPASSESSKIEKSLFDEKNMTSLTIPAGTCAKVRHVGSDEELGDIINYLYGDWLASQEKSLRDFPLFFERVSFFPDVAEAEMITDVFLPLA